MTEFTQNERSQAWEKLAARWSITEHYWYPLTGKEPADTLALYAPHFKQQLGGKFLHSVLNSEGVVTLIEFCEDGDASSLSANEVDFEYTGLEAFWSAPPFDWIVYCSHESSITLGGRSLLEPLKQAWPRWRNSQWRSPFERDYVRIEDSGGRHV